MKKKFLNGEKVQYTSLQGRTLFARFVQQNYRPGITSAHVEISSEEGKVLAQPIMSQHEAEQFYKCMTDDWILLKALKAATVKQP